MGVVIVFSVLIGFVGFLFCFSCCVWRKVLFFCVFVVIKIGKLLFFSVRCCVNVLLGLCEFLCGSSYVSFLKRIVLVLGKFWCHCKWMSFTCFSGSIWSVHCNREKFLKFIFGCWLKYRPCIVRKWSMHLRIISFLDIRGKRPVSDMMFHLAIFPGLLGVFSGLVWGFTYLFLFIPLTPLNPVFINAEWKVHKKDYWHLSWCPWTISPGDGFLLYCCILLCAISSNSDKERLRCFSCLSNLLNSANRIFSFRWSCLYSGCFSKNERASL